MPSSAPSLHPLLDYHDISVRTTTVGHFLPLHNKEKRWHAPPVFFPRNYILQYYLSVNEIEYAEAPTSISSKALSPLI
jgi:hypothetical protein